MPLFSFPGLIICLCLSQIDADQSGNTGDNKVFSLQYQQLSCGQHYSEMTWKGNTIINCYNQSIPSVLYLRIPFRKYTAQFFPGISKDDWHEDNSFCSNK